MTLARHLGIYLVPVQIFVSEVHELGRDARFMASLSGSPLRYLLLEGESSRLIAAMIDF